MAWFRVRGISQRTIRPAAGWMIAGIVLLHALPVTAAHELTEPATEPRVFNVICRLNVNGKLETSLTGGKAQAHDLMVTAAIDYRERRLSGAGRDAAALRSLRYYDKADVTVKVGEQTTSTRLPKRARLIVAQGRRDGVAPYSPNGPLTSVDLELLRVSGDSLATLALLPRQAVDPDDEWTCDGWVLQMLTGTEAVVKSELKCQLVSVKGNTAEVKYEGSLEGATSGALTKITVTGTYRYNLKDRYISRFELIEQEKRALGTRPGYDVTARVIVERTLADRPGPLTDELAARIALEPTAEEWMLQFDVPWGVRFQHDRDWHLFRQSEQASVLRLLDKGSFVAQCNVAKISAAGPGKHTPESRFQADIRKALGDKLKEIAKAELLKSDDGVYRYRVTATGDANGIPVTWLYYLCAAPSGRQVAFVFAVETKQLDRLANRDLGMVRSVQFRDPAIRPVKAGP